MCRKQLLCAFLKITHFADAASVCGVVMWFLSSYAMVCFVCFFFYSERNREVRKTIFRHPVTLNSGVDAQKVW